MYVVSVDVLSCTGQICGLLVLHSTTLCLLFNLKHNTLCVAVKPHTQCATEDRLAHQRKGTGHLDLTGLA